MRKLKVSDVGKASKILKKLELRVDDGVTTPEELGASLMLKAMENYHKAEQEIAEFMSALVDDMTPSKFLGLELNEALPYFKKISEDEGLQDFLKLLGKLS